MVEGDTCDFLVCLLLENVSFSLKYDLPKSHLETVYTIDAMAFVVVLYGFSTWKLDHLVTCPRGI